MTPPFRKIVLDETDSTNSEARRRAEAGAPDGLAVVARRQTTGRGRRGRRWESPEGNLYVSLLLRPDRPLAEAALLSFVAAVALGEAVAAMLPPEAPIAFKWPNDLLVGGAKCAGMLLESSAAGAGRLDWLIVGVGVNLASHPEGLPYPATDLAAAGAPAPTPDAALETFLERFAHWRDIWSRRGFAPVRRACRHALRAVFADAPPPIVRPDEVFGFAPSCGPLMTVAAALASLQGGGDAPRHVLAAGCDLVGDGFAFIFERGAS